jgi:hypothetical protein
VRGGGAGAPGHSHVGWHQAGRRPRESTAGRVHQPRARLARLRQAKARLDAEAAQHEQTYKHRVAASIASATAADRPAKASYRYRPRDEAPRPDATVNTTDPDSRLIRSRHGTVQGYNAQAVATTEQVIVAAALTQQTSDRQQLAPMLTTLTATLTSARR